jgi:hypothetical protein
VNWFVEYDELEDLMQRKNLNTKQKHIRHKAVGMTIVFVRLPEIDSGVRLLDSIRSELNFCAFEVLCSISDTADAQKFRDCALDD